MKLTRLCSHAPVAALLPARVGQLNIYIGLTATARVNLPTMSAMVRFGILLSMWMEGYAFQRKSELAIWHEMSIRRAQRSGRG